MIPNLPLFSSKPSAPTAPSDGITRGWQQSGPALDRQGDRRHDATTSIANVFGSSHKSPSVSSSGRSSSASSVSSTQGVSATSSIARATGRGRGALTTAGRPGDERRSYAHTQSAGEADDARYSYGMRLRAKKRAEAMKHVKKEVTSDLSLKTGAGAKSAAGIAKELKKLRTRKSATYGHLSDGDITHLAGIMSNRAKSSSTGQGFSRIARASMKQDVMKGYKAGNYTSLDATKFKKLIDQLPK
ncbi:MAG: hypothetical protein ABII02_01345 [Candidatus Magasanikbacteria bacterium]